MAWNVSSDPARFDESIEWFRSKTPFTARRYYELESAARDRSFTISNTAQMDVIQGILDDIDRAIQNGTSLGDFSAHVSEKLEEAWGGSVANPGHRIETIYRTNIQSAFSRGRQVQMDQPEVKALRPGRLFDAVRDHGTTPVCRECDGTLVDADDPWLADHIPPLHHQCRSRIRAVRMTEVRRRGGFTAAHKLPRIGPDAGFGEKPNFDRDIIQRIDTDFQSYDRDLAEAGRRKKLEHERRLQQEEADRRRQELEAERAKRDAEEAERLAREAQRKKDDAARKKAERKRRAAERKRKDAEKKAAKAPAKSAEEARAKALIEARRDISEAVRDGAVDAQKLRSALDRHIRESLGLSSWEERHSRTAATEFGFADLPAGYGAAHDWDGRIIFPLRDKHLVLSGIRNVRLLDDAGLPEEFKRAPRQILVDMLHETLHGFSPLSRSAYDMIPENGGLVQYGSACLEEVCTEVLAQAAVGSRPAHNSRMAYEHIAYQFFGIIESVLGVSQGEAVDLFTAAAISLRRPDAQMITSPSKHISAFVDVLAIGFPEHRAELINAFAGVKNTIP